VKLKKNREIKKMPKITDPKPRRPLRKSPRLHPATSCKAGEQNEPINNDKRQNEKNKETTKNGKPRKHGKPFSCDLCGYVTPHKFNLNRHFTSNFKKPRK